MEASVDEDLPAWCRLTGNRLVGRRQDGSRRSFLVSKRPFTKPSAEPATPTDIPAKKTSRAHKSARMEIVQEVVEPFIPNQLPPPAPAPVIPPLSTLSVGSWPRPRWLLQALHAHLAGRLGDEEFDADADDAVRLAVAAQMRADVDMVTDDEQRRDNYASFVGGLLQNCQLIPITDLLPYVGDPEQFERELRALDVPAGEVRHPAVFGPLGRHRPLAVHEARFVRGLTDRPVKVSLPGPYLLTRTMWMECISDRAYLDCEQPARDVGRVLREEAHHLLAAGVALVQFDEPVLTEVVYGVGGLGGARSCAVPSATEAIPTRSLTSPEGCCRRSPSACHQSGSRSTSAAATGLPMRARRLPGLPAASSTARVAERADAPAGALHTASRGPGCPYRLA